MIDPPPSMMKRGFPLVLLILAVLAACTPARLTVQDAWARPAASGGPGAVYFVIDNPTTQGDALLSARSEAAEAVELHISSMDSSGVMSMHPQHEVGVPARGTLEFQPGGYHVMLINLLQDLNPGDSFQLELEFRNAGTVLLEVPVRAP